MMRFIPLFVGLCVAGCTSPPPPEAWEAANVKAQAYADRVERLKRKEPRRAQQVAAEAILLSYQSDLAPNLRELCGPTCVAEVEYRFGALRLAYQQDDGPADGAREALVKTLREVVHGAPTIEASPSTPPQSKPSVASTPTPRSASPE